MDNHPIPQDVTGFQFKLIGNMTIKQFAYLASGCVIALLFFYSPFFILIRLLFILFFAGLGAGLAFLPIEGRPMDLMISYFVKDLFVSTQYIYQKGGGMLPISMISTHPLIPKKPAKEQAKKKEKDPYQREIKLNQFLNQMSKAHHTKLDDREDLYLSAIFDPNALPQLMSYSEQQSAAAHLPQDEEALKLQAAQSPEVLETQLELETEAIRKELELAMNEEKKLAENKQTSEIAHEHVTDLEQQLNSIMQQKQQLEQEILKLKDQLPAQPSVNQAEPVQTQSSQNVRMVPTDKANSIGLPAVPDVPNIILGIIKDPRGNLLPGILVEIKDKDDNPVRAFKTNGLGQFASATKLADGIYTIHFEDLKGKHEFEVVQIEAKGEIMLPLEIISHDAREKLRRELFN